MSDWWVSRIVYWFYWLLLLPYFKSCNLQSSRVRRKQMDDFDALWSTWFRTKASRQFFRCEKVAHAQEQTLFANPFWPAVTDLCLDSGVVQPVLSRGDDIVLSEPWHWTHYMCAAPEHAATVFSSFFPAKQQVLTLQLVDPPISTSLISTTRQWRKCFLYFLLESIFEAEQGNFACTAVSWSYQTVSNIFVAFCCILRRMEKMVQMKPCQHRVWCHWIVSTAELCTAWNRGRLDFRTYSWHCWVLLYSVAPTLLLHFGSNVFPSWRPLAPWWKVMKSEKFCFCKVANVCRGSTLWLPKTV